MRIQPIWLAVPLVLALLWGLAISSMPPRPPEVGASYAAAFVGAAIGPLPFGIVYDAVGSYDPVIWGLAVLPLLTTWGALLAKPPPQTLER